MPSELFEHMLAGFSDEEKERLGVGQYRLGPQPFSQFQFLQPLPGARLPVTYPQSGYKSVQPIVPTQGLVAYNFVPFVKDANGNTLSHMFADIPVLQMSVPPAQLKQRLQLVVGKYAPLLKNVPFGASYLCYGAYQVSNGQFADIVCSPGFPAQLQYPLTWP